MTAKNDEKLWSISDILATTSQYLQQKGASSPRLDAELLLGRVLNLPRVKLYINFDRVLTSEELNAYRELVKRRSQSEPVAYILGEKEFYGLNFKVSSDVLIPRPETEHLIDAVIRQQSILQVEQPKILDIGTGSGAIALTLAYKLPNAQVTAIDISDKALSIASENLKKLKLENKVNFLLGDLLEPLKDISTQYDYICANLPYIPKEEMLNLMPDVGSYEPSLALDGGIDGLSIIERLLSNVKPYLKQDSYIFLEIWPNSLIKLENNIDSYGLEISEVVKDYSDKARIVILKLKA